MLIQWFSQFPRPLQIGVGLLFFNSVLLFAWWLIFPNDVQSNGGQVFFIMLWFSAGWGLLLGEGWIRAGIACLLVAFVWGIANQPNMLEGIANVNLADIVSKVLACAAVVCLYLPASRIWFAARRESSADSELATKDPD